jgi:hypothetical protein
MNDKKLYFQLGEILVQLHPLGRFGFETFRGQDCGRVFLGQVGSQFADLLGKTNNKNIVSVYFYNGKANNQRSAFSPRIFLAIPFDMGEKMQQDSRKKGNKRGTSNN